MLPLFRLPNHATVRCAVEGSKIGRYSETHFCMSLKHCHISSSFDVVGYVHGCRIRRFLNASNVDEFQGVQLCTKSFFVGTVGLHGGALKTVHVSKQECQDRVAKQQIAVEDTGERESIYLCIFPSAPSTF